VHDVSVEIGDGQGPVAEALLAAGFPPGGASPWARVVTAGDATFEAVSRDVQWVLKGGVLAICGGTGPLLAALHLTPGETAVEGPVEPLAPGAPPLPLAGAWPVTGVGYALYRAGERCVAIAGRRGDGWIAYVGTPEPLLVAACLSWIAS
jgi:putative intracellular protease/amidase